MILEIKNLSKTYGDKQAVNQALKGVSFSLKKGEILGIVGESGSGKTTLLKLVSGLEKPDAGEILLDGKPLSAKRTKDDYRRMQMIFQDAVASFHPRRTIADSIRETTNSLLGRAEKPDLNELSERVGLSIELMERRPGNLSGGQCQRFAIARALSVHPEILLCDEITSALDVSNQAQILRLLSGICRDTGTSALFVSHDLAVVSNLCDRILVMKDGVIVEEGDARQIIHEPKEAYTQKLIESVMEVKDVRERVQKYWTIRTKDFNAIRLNELHDEISDRWSAELNARIPCGKALDVLDAGTGTGYFAVLLGREGHRVTGIDLTASMLEEARKTAELFKVDAGFLQMDVQETDFAEESFDVIVTRNVTWTLPDPGKAYNEWYRLLRPGGILLNFDANYADNVRNHNQKESWVKPKDVYGHIGITKELSEENAGITLAMPASRHHRPQWDGILAKEAGFSEWGADEEVGKRVLREHDLSDAPLFLFWARK